MTTAHKFPSLVPVGQLPLVAHLNLHFARALEEDHLPAVLGAHLVELEDPVVEALGNVVADVEAEGEAGQEDGVGAGRGGGIRAESRWRPAFGIKLTVGIQVTNLL